MWGLYLDMSFISDASSWYWTNKRQTNRAVNRTAADATEEVGGRTPGQHWQPRPRRKVSPPPSGTRKKLQAEFPLYLILHPLSAQNPRARARTLCLTWSGSAVPASRIAATRRCRAADWSTSDSAAASCSLSLSNRVLASVRIFSMVQLIAASGPQSEHRSPVPRTQRVPERVSALQTSLPGTFKRSLCGSRDMRLRSGSRTSGRLVTVFNLWLPHILALCRAPEACPCHAFGFLFPLPGGQVVLRLG